MGVVEFGFGCIVELELDLGLGGVGELVVWGSWSGGSSARFSVSGGVSEWRPIGFKGSRRVPLLGLGSMNRESHTML